MNCSKKGPGLEAIPGDVKFDFNVSRYPQETLENTKHSYELVPSRSIIVCLDYMQSGIGSMSCGPHLIKDYRLDAETFTFKVNLLPRYTK